VAARIGHSFSDPALLTLALTHSSYCAEHPGTEANERLEFLGDAVLGLIVAEHLYQSHPGAPEGDLHLMRSAVVDAATLAEVGAELGLGEAVRLGRGEELSGGRVKRSILADGTEAVLGAVYLDAGLDVSRRVVLGVLGDRLAAAADAPGTGDAKSRLNELAAHSGMPVPTYDVADDGPDHAKSFVATVTLDGHRLGQGEGRSKKQAEQAAARDAWDHLAADDDTDPSGPRGRRGDA
jgi:ribonuclease-3